MVPRLRAPEQLKAEHTEKIESEDNHDHTRNQIDRCPVLSEKAADRSRKRPHRHKDETEAEHKTGRIPKRLSETTLTAARKIAHIDRQERQETGGDEGDHALQE